MTRPHAMKPAFIRLGSDYLLTYLLIGAVDGGGYCGFWLHV